MSEEENRLQAIMDAVVDSIITINQQGLIQSSNLATETIFGYAASELLGKNVKILMPEPYVSEHDEYLRHYMTTDDKHIIGLVREVEGKSKNGEIFPIELSISEARIKGQRIFTGIIRDISARKAVETALLRSQEQLKATIESALDCIIAIDHHGNVTQFNPAAERTFGYTVQQTIGYPLAELIIPPQLREAHNKGMAKFLATGEGPVLGKRIEIEAMRSDGSFFPIELAIEVASGTDTPIFVAYLRDITEEKQTREKMEILARFPDENPNPVIRINDQGVVLYGNIASQLILDLWESPVNQYVPGNILVDLQKALQENESFTSEEETKGCIFALTFAPIPSGGYVNVYGRDITERRIAENEIKRFIQQLLDSRKKLEEKTNQLSELAEEETQLKIVAQSADKSKSEFLAMMSHEIRTPLNGVLGILGLMKDTPLNNEQSAYVDTGRQSAEGLLSIINDILDFSKMEAGKLDFEKVDFSLSGIVENVTELLTQEAKDKGLEIITDMAQDLPTYVSGDPGRIRQILLNLSGNAVKFTETGSVTLKLSKAQAKGSPPALRFAITDTGIGIDKDKQGRVFQSFDTVDASYSREFGGTGLGLAISKRLVEMMDGEIGLHSSLGQGSTFWFELPLSEVETPVVDSALQTNNKPKRTRTTSGRLRILMAEDNATNRMVAKAMLEKVGYLIDTAANGVEAVAAVRSLPYDLVLMDIAMPEMDGMEATKQIRALEGDKADIPIIALTAHAMKGYRDQVIEAGMDDYLQKPIDRDILIEAIERWCGEPLEASPLDKTSPKTKTTPQAQTKALLDRAIIDKLAEETSREIMPTLIATFTDDSAQRLTRVRTYCETKDFSGLEMETHTLGSSAGTFGAIKLYEMAREMELSCTNGDEKVFEQAETLINLAEGYFADLEKIAGEFV